MSKSKWDLLRLPRLHSDLEFLLGVNLHSAAAAGAWAGPWGATVTAVVLSHGASHGHLQSHPAQLLTQRLPRGPASGTGRSRSQS